MGGISISGHIDSIEIYNPKTNLWSMKKLSTIHHPICGAVVVTKPVLRTI